MRFQLLNEWKLNVNSDVILLFNFSKNAYIINIAFNF